MATEQLAELVMRAQQGDGEAFAVLYERYAPKVHAFLRRRLNGSDDVVEDLTSDVFVKLYQKLDCYVERGLPFTAWLYRMAHNTLVDYLRSQKGAYTTPLEGAAEVAESSSGTAFGRVLDRQTLAPALARLTPEQRQAVELRFLAGLSVAETAVRIGRSEEAVKKLQARGLARLRRYLTPTGAAADRQVILAA